MDVVCVMAAYSDPLCSCRKALTYGTFRKVVPSYTVSYTHTHNGSEYAAIIPTLSISTDTIEPFL